MYSWGSQVIQNCENYVLWTKLNMIRSNYLHSVWKARLYRHPRIFLSLKNTDILQWNLSTETTPEIGNATPQGTQFLGQVVCNTDLTDETNQCYRLSVLNKHLLLVTTFVTLEIGLYSEVLLYFCLVRILSFVEWHPREYDWSDSVECKCALELVVTKLCYLNSHEQCSSIPGVSSTGSAWLMRSH